MLETALSKKLMDGYDCTMLTKYNTVSKIQVCEEIVAKLFANLRLTSVASKCLSFFWILIAADSGGPGSVYCKG